MRKTPSPNSKGKQNSGRNDMSGIRFIYFDLDDTLIDHKKAQDRALADLWTRYPELQSSGPEVLISVYAGVNNKLWHVYRNSGIGQNELKRIRFEKTFSELGVRGLDWREAEAAYMEFYQRHWEWIDDAREVFTDLAKRYPVGVLTNGFNDIQKKKFEHFSLNRYARELIVSEQTGYLKPDPRIFQYAADLAGYPPESLLYVGDSHSSDIEGGSRSGWKTAWYAVDKEPVEDSPANLIFTHFSELKKALT